MSILLLLNGIQSSLISGPLMVLGPPKQNDDMERYFSAMTILQGTISTVMAAFVTVGVAALGTLVEVNGALRDGFLFMGMSLLFIQGQDFVRKLLLTKLQVHVVLRNDLIYCGLLFCGLFVFWYLGGGTWTPGSPGYLSAATAFIAAGGAAAVAAGLGLYHCRTPLTRSFADIKVYFCENWLLGKWGLATFCLSYFGNQLAVIVIALMIGMAGTAIYEASRLMSGPVQMIQLAMSNLITVYAASLFVNQSPNRAWTFISLVTKIGLACFVTYYLVLYAFADSIIVGTVGEKYVKETPAIFLFGLYYLGNWLHTNQAAYISAARRPDIVFWGSVANVVITMPLLFLLVGMSGPVGGVLAMVVGLAANILAKHYQMKRCNILL